MSYLLNTDEILQTIRMIDQQHLDVRTITLGLSLLDCAGEDIELVQRNRNRRTGRGEYITTKMR